MDELFAKMAQASSMERLRMPPGLRRGGFDAGIAPGDILDKSFVKGMEEVGDLFAKGDFLPANLRRSPRRRKRDTGCSRVSMSVLRDGGGQMSCARLVVWDAEDSEKIHQATLQILESVGVEVRNYPQALELFADAGARVEGNRVRIEPQVVEKALASAPRSWLVHSRGRAQTLDLKDGNSYFGPGSDCLYIRDPDTHERRRIAQADIEGMAALCEKLVNLDFVMTMGLPGDAPLLVDDVAAVAAMFQGTRKPIMVAPKDGLSVKYVRQMAEACGQADSVMIYAMPSPPLMHDADALSKLLACAELEVPLIYAPAPSCGTTAPRSVAAAMVVGNAKVLSGLVLHQFVKTGAPFVMGAEEQELPTCAPGAIHMWRPSRG